MDFYNYETIDLLNEIIKHYQSQSLRNGVTTSKIYEYQSIITGLTKAKFDIALALSKKNS